MLISKVKKLSPEARFLYWVKERHLIHLRRQAGKPKPWTDDKVLQTGFFTNPYRENDKTTVWFREHVREPLRDDPQVLLTTIIFRWFNLIVTGEFLANEGLLYNWYGPLAKQLLAKRRRDGYKLFTGAYLIQSPGGEPKMEAICDRIDKVWQDRHALLAAINVRHESGPCSLEEAHSYLTQYDGIGAFMAYEIVCDLRYTYLLENAPDINTWCNPGPGCIRGLYRLAGEKIPAKNNSTMPRKMKDWQERMQYLLKVTQRHFKRNSKFPPFEMREIEHSLCEADKYNRALFGDGRLKRTYDAC